MAIFIGKPIGTTPNGEVIFEAEENVSIDKVQKFRTIVNEIAETYERKNHDCGDSFDISVSKYGLIAAITRMSDKFNRAERLILGADNKVCEENILDTLKDLACYAIMTVMAIEEINKNI